MVLKMCNLNPSHIYINNFFFQVKGFIDPPEVYVQPPLIPLHKFNHCLDLAHRGFDAGVKGV